MTKLDCSVVNCMYNSENSCRKEMITVGGHEAHNPSETACKSFAQRGSQGVKNAGCGMPKKETEIACDAVNCRFNENKVCAANHIKIAGKHAVTNGETECGSFEQK